MFNGQQASQLVKITTWYGIDKYTMFMLRKQINRYWDCLMRSLGTHCIHTQPLLRIAITMKVVITMGPEVQQDRSIWLLTSSVSRIIAVCSTVFILNRGDWASIFLEPWL
jgi:hypothetical protein